eukprot:7208190-Prymnesium_polylepis.2
MHHPQSAHREVPQLTELVGRACGATPPGPIIGELVEWPEHDRHRRELLDEAGHQRQLGVP